MAVARLSKSECGTSEKAKKLPTILECKVKKGYQKFARKYAVIDPPVCKVRSDLDDNDNDNEVDNDNDNEVFICYVTLNLGH